MKMQIPRNTPPANDPQELVRHFSATYFSLRLGLAILAFGFPFVLFAYGRLRHGLDLQPSMSAYFWAAAAADQCATFPMRTLFVGFLFAIGVGLYAYKGFTPLENVLLNVAGVCAAMVAIFPETIVPEDAKTDPRIDKLFQTCPAVKAWAEQDPMLIHYAAAVGLFVLLAIVSWRCAEKTLDYAPDTVDIDWFRRAYKIIAVGMLVFPLPGLAVAWALGLWDTHKVFFIEALTGRSRAGNCGCRSRRRSRSRRSRTRAGASSARPRRRRPRPLPRPLRRATEARPRSRDHAG
jgi:hypothetical protein